jgi:ATPase family associated with various cellular activities (AAA)/AAA+ lid domain
MRVVGSNLSTNRDRHPLRLQGPPFPIPAPSDRLRRALEDLELLIQSRYPILYVETYEEERLEELLVAAASHLGLPFWTWSVTQGLERRGIDQPVYDTAKPLVALRHIASLSTSGLYLLRDFHPYLTDPTVVRELREFAQNVSGRLVTLVLCSPALALPIELRKLSARYQLDLPDEQEIRMAVVDTFRQLNAHRRFRYELDEAALTRFARNLRGLTRTEVRRLVTRSAFDDFALNEADIPRVLERKRAALESSSTLEFVSVDSGVAPLGGLTHLKQWLDRFRAGFSERARELGIPPPRGVLLVGVQGCGKSLAAKTIARRWEIPLARLDPGRLFDKFIGESEKNLREALATASAAAPIVLWIDEIEKVFADTGGEADAGLGRRLFGTFLTWLQERKEMVFVAATANELGQLPPELLRKGRFDEIFFIDLPGEAERKEIFGIHLRLRKQDPEKFDLPELVRATAGFSGAEIEQAVVAAIYGMLAENAETLTTERLLDEIGRTSPLSWTRREQIEALRQNAHERFVMAN